MAIIWTINNTVLLVRYQTCRDSYSKTEDENLYSVQAALMTVYRLNLFAPSSLRGCLPRYGDHGLYGNTPPKRRGISYIERPWNHFFRYINPLSPKSDKRQISPCNITAL